MAPSGSVGTGLDVVAAFALLVWAVEELGPRPATLAAFPPARNAVRGVLVLDAEAHCAFVLASDAPGSP